MVLAILGILVVISAVPLTAYFRATGFDKGVEQVRDDLKEARARATSEAAPGQVYGVAFTPGSGEYEIFRSDPSETVRKASLGSGVVVSAATCTPPGFPAGEDCYFYARGTASPGEVEIIQDGSSRSAKLTILPLTGRVEEDG